MTHKSLMTTMALAISLVPAAVSANDIPHDVDGTQAKGAIHAGDGTFMVLVVDKTGVIDVFKLKNAAEIPLTREQAETPQNVPGTILRDVIVYETAGPHRTCIRLKHDDIWKELCLP